MHGYGSALELKITATRVMRACSAPVAHSNSQKVGL
jgi:hypothetical protein